MDSQQASGNVTTIISLETTDGITIVSRSNYFQRHLKDRSYVSLSSSNASNDFIYGGQSTQFTISVSQIKNGGEKSYSNAYNVEVFVHYDRYFLEFVSLKSVARGYWSIAPSRNATRPGLVYLQTKVFSFYNTQLVSIKLKMKHMQQELKGAKCDGSIIIDLRYENNLPKFQGTSAKVISKIIPYQFKINDKEKGEAMLVGRRIPMFTMAYDRASGSFFFCFQRKQYITRNSPCCYWQGEGSSAWDAVSDIVAILGIDTKSKIIYGIHRDGEVYLRAPVPFITFYQIEESMWKSVENRPEMTKAISANDRSAMPSSITRQFTISKADAELWAATRFGILKKEGQAWKEAVKF